MKRDFLSILDLKEGEITCVLQIAKNYKREKKWKKFLKEKNFALIFEKPSLRTRMSFEVGIRNLGGNPIYLAPQDIKLGEREGEKDIAKNLETWVDGIIARVFSHNSLLVMAQEAKIPVINALSDLEHPCQILADLQTIKEYSEKDFSHITLSYIGDGNNVCHSLILAFSILGAKINIASPCGYEPKKEILEKAKEISRKTNAEIFLTESPLKAVENADFIYTDVWTSMGQEQEREERKKIFKDYQVNRKLLEKAGKKIKFMHCLPAHRGEEVTDDVIDNKEISIVYEQAENRLWAQMALLKILYEK